jgi:hypothetical protein
MFNKSLASKTPMKSGKILGQLTPMRKTVIGFAFQSGRVSADLMNEYVENGNIAVKNAEQRQKAISQAIKIRKRRQINMTPGLVSENQIEP